MALDKRICNKHIGGEKMNVGSTNGIGVTADVYAAYTTAESAAKKTEEKTDKTGDTAARKENAEGAVYEKSAGTDDKKTPYAIHKMSSEDRASLVQQLKSDQEQRQSQLLDIVRQMMSKQAATYAQAGTSDDMWKFLAKGDFTVDAQTKAQAQADIAEDGYWGVKQTSQRLFDFASALAGDDVEQMKKMQTAMEKGYKQAAKAWGQDLPDISKQTLDAVNKLFEDYYASKENTEE